jgi:hypothetical protein
MSDSAFVLAGCVPCGAVLPVLELVLEPVLVR